MVLLGQGPGGTGIGGADGHRARWRSDFNTASWPGHHAAPPGGSTHYLRRDLTRFGLLWWRPAASVGANWLWNTSQWTMGPHTISCWWPNSPIRWPPKSVQHQMPRGAAARDQIGPGGRQELGRAWWQNIAPPWQAARWMAAAHCPQPQWFFLVGVQIDGNCWPDAPPRGRPARHYWIWWGTVSSKLVLWSAGLARASYVVIVTSCLWACKEDESSLKVCEPRHRRQSNL